jgi:hypothetical protein
MNWHAVNLALTAPYDTVQLSATPRTPDGTVLPDSGTIQYMTTDSAVTVSATGLVTARYTTARTAVVARLTVQGLTLTDTTVIKVTASPLPAPLASLSIQPRPGGLAAAHMNVTNISPGRVTVPFYATIASGNPATDTICGARGCPNYPLVVAFASSNPAMAEIDRTTGVVKAHQIGRVTLSVATLAYGVAKVDSLPFSVGYPLVAIATVKTDSTKTPHVPTLNGLQEPLSVSIGGRVFASNAAGQSIEVSLPAGASGIHFTGPNPARTKDTVATGKLESLAVQFDSTGTYALQYRLLNSGTVISHTFVIQDYP